MSVRQALLALLEQGPMYGYQLRAEFERRTGSTWPLNVGQVYTTLTRLERDGLVAESGDDGEGHVVYRVTDAGREEVATWFTTPVERTQPPRDELAIKLALAVTVPGVDVGTVIQQQRTATMTALQDYTRLKRAGRAADPQDASDMAWSLVLDSLVFAAEAEVRWLDHCEARLRRAQLERADDVPGTPDHLGASRIGRGRPMTAVLQLDAVTRVARRGRDRRAGAARASRSPRTPASSSRSWARPAPASPRCSPWPAGSTARRPARSRSRAPTSPRWAPTAAPGCGVRRSATSSRTST